MLAFLIALFASPLSHAKVINSKLHYLKPLTNHNVTKLKNLGTPQKLIKIGSTGISFVKFNTGNSAIVPSSLLQNLKEAGIFYAALQNTITQTKDHTFNNEGKVSDQFIQIFSENLNSAEELGKKIYEMIVSNDNIINAATQGQIYDSATMGININMIEDKINGIMSQFEQRLSEVFEYGGWTPPDTGQKSFSQDDGWGYNGTIQGHYDATSGSWIPDVVGFFTDTNNGDRSGDQVTITHDENGNETHTQTDDLDIDDDGKTNNADDDMDGDNVPNDEDDDQDGDGVPDEEDPDDTNKCDPNPCEDESGITAESEGGRMPFSYDNFLSLIEEMINRIMERFALVISNNTDIDSFQLSVYQQILSTYVVSFEQSNMSKVQTLTKKLINNEITEQQFKSAYENAFVNHFKTSLK